MKSSEVTAMGFNLPGKFRFKPHFCWIDVYGICQTVIKQNMESPFISLWHCIVLLMFIAFHSKISYLAETQASILYYVWPHDVIFNTVTKICIKSLHLIEILRLLYYYFFLPGINIWPVIYSVFNCCHNMSLLFVGFSSYL